MPVTTRSKRQKLPLPPPATAEALSYDLLSDIIDHILLKLPSRSLLRFRCVCKSWSALISDPKFVQSHHGQSQASIYQTKLLFRHQCKRSFWAVCADDEKKTSIENLYFPGNRNFDILCSCDGLVLLKEHICRPSASGSGHIYYLWNPSVRKYVKLSYPSQFTTYRRRFDQGLCYDSSTCDYKLVVIHHSSRYSIYSVEKDSWSEIKLYPYQHLLLNSNVFVNGVQHWVASFGRRMIKGIYYPLYVCIVGYKPKEDDFCVYPLPNPLILEKKRDWDCYLTVLGGCLGLYTYSCSSRSMKIWLRTGQDYKDPSSWEKFIFISYLPVPDASMLVTLLYFVRDNELLLYIEEGRLVLYDIREEKFLEMDGLPSPDINIGKYIDSLLLPGIGGNPRKRWLTTEKRGHLTAVFILAGEANMDFIRYGVCQSYCAPS